MSDTSTTALGWHVWLTIEGSACSVNSESLGVVAISTMTLFIIRTLIDEGLDYNKQVDEYMMQLTEINEYLIKLCTSSLYLFWNRKAMKTLVAGVVGFITVVMFLMSLEWTILMITKMFVLKKLD